MTEFCRLPHSQIHAHLIFDNFTHFYSNQPNIKKDTRTGKNIFTRLKLGKAKHNGFKEHDPKI